MKLIGAALARSAKYRDDGSVEVTDPYSGTIYVPTKYRSAVASGEIQYVTLPIGAFAAVLRLVEGTPGVSFHLLSVVVYPTGETVRIGAGTLRWPDDRVEYHAIIHASPESILGFKQSGNYEVRFLVNGERLGGLILPVRWEDERD